jgi:hypothetical protein
METALAKSNIVGGSDSQLSQFYTAADQKIGQFAREPY